MCGRYTIASPNPFDVRARFPVGESIEIRRRYNVAPGDEVLAVTTDRAGSARGQILRWGLVPSWAKDSGNGYKMINARAETIEERPAFRRSFQHMRCLIPADGFYEWQRRETDLKRPFHITLADGALFAFAGLWAIRHDDDGSVLRTCTIVTTQANEALAPLHDRMPVILPLEAEAEWLDPRTPAERLRVLLRPLPSELTSLRPVSRVVGDVRHDGPECLEPPEAPAGEQVALF